MSTRVLDVIFSHIWCSCAWYLKLCPSQKALTSHGFQDPNGVCCSRANDWVGACRTFHVWSAFSPRHPAVRVYDFVIHFQVNRRPSLRLNDPQQ
jgi:hypothetical protein